MMTSHTFKDDEQHPLKLGASYFMPKPFTLQAIVQLIAHLSPAAALQV
jgi:CheY-like chemotaxis protein